MGTYVTTNPAVAGQRMPIMVQNFIMVENLNEIGVFLSGYTTAPNVNLPVINNDIQCISIWNKDREWTAQPVPNTVNPVVQDTGTLYVKYGNLESLEQMYGDNNLKFSVIGRGCILKQIFFQLTRFKAQHLEIQTGGGRNVAQSIGPNDDKTLDNRIIFVKKSNIKDLFEPDTLTNNTNDNFNWEDSLKDFLRTHEFNNRQCISNFFRTFDSFILFGQQPNQELRDSLGLGQEVPDNRLEGFIQAINNTRNIRGAVIIQGDTNNIINTIINIINRKTARQGGEENTITTLINNEQLKQHWLGYTYNNNSFTFRHHVRARLQRLLEIQNTSVIERYIIFILAITATNGKNHRGGIQPPPTPPPNANVNASDLPPAYPPRNPCVLVPVERQQ